ncbi:MAG: cysteine--tRNA ligase [Thaumarchaeota archaeon]|nr:cysteine--tRNA ligase [Nitrososphaerota archaeon]
MASRFKTQPDLKVYNTMTMQKEPFQTRIPGKVSMFVCGPTVQSYLHVGHARTYTFYDVVARYLSHLGFEVNFLMNVTDIDDKITQAAKAEGMDPIRLAERYTKAFLEDTDSLKIYTVTKYERVSNYVQETMRQISTLIASGNAYVADGTVYFNTATFPDFGKLSHLTTKELSLRPLELSVKKKHLLDFALWRPVILVEGRWDSPWGRGSPGWHIQDTAVTLTNFGPQYDVHGGGYELIYPHHEAEIAQGESLTKVKPLVKYWVHTGLVNIEGNKMSKSLGNVLSVRDALKQYGSDTLRLYLLSHHYRVDMDFQEKGLKQMHETYLALRAKAKIMEERRATKARRRDSGKVLAQFYAFLNDDFDTPQAIAFMMKLIEDGASEKDQNQVELYYEALRITSNILGVNFFGRLQ